MKENRLYVGNLSFDATEEDLNELFGQAGTVLEVDIVENKFHDRHRGFAFVTMESNEEALKAIDMFHEQEHMGRNLQVNVARPKEEHAPTRDRRSRRY